MFLKDPTFYASFFFINGVSFALACSSLESVSYHGKTPEDFKKGEHVKTEVISSNFPTVITLIMFFFRFTFPCNGGVVFTFSFFKPCCFHCS